jgi:hypothetical protein
MSKRILDVDPSSATTTWHHYDPLTDETVIETVQDASVYLQRNKMLRDDDDYKKRGIKNSWWHAASIPNGLIAKWKADFGIDVYNKDHWPRVKRLLNDPEYRYLRTGTGKL